MPTFVERIYESGLVEKWWLFRGDDAPFTLVDPLTNSSAALKVACSENDEYADVTLTSGPDTGLRVRGNGLVWEADEQETITRLNHNSNLVLQVPDEKLGRFILLAFHISSKWN